MSEVPPADELAVFGEALEIADADRRAAFLDEACGADAELRRKVDDLLAAHGELGEDCGFLGGGGDGEPLDETNGGIGERVGRYKLLQKIGEGGWGIVYLAEQTEPVRRRVALKIIKPGMDTRQVMARFEAERQALAMMDHPNIAHVLDAGATDAGRPYFVMELVRGIKITDYCDKNRLTPEQRLELFMAVCHAVQHAHQKGIIHRDIKPSNILVTSDGGKAIPKVIDFGVAKATADVQLTDKTLFTRFEMFVGTPAYMSPEQAEFSAQGVDTRTDIYALGVLLYELLTGETPFNSATLISAGVDAMRRTIREQEPQRPSTRIKQMPQNTAEAVMTQRQSDQRKLTALLRGDLDRIVLKALEKDRTRRYETANGLAMDVGRFLQNEPVSARPPSAAYSFRKWTRKHRAIFLGSAAVLAALILGIIASTWQAVRATAAEHKQRELREKSDTDRAAADAARNEAIVRAYAADMKATSVAIAAGNYGHANDLLARYAPRAGEQDIRGFEWHLLHSRCAGDEIASFDNAGICTGVAIAPDNSWVAAGAKYAEVTVWDAATGKVLQKFPAMKESEWRCSLAMSPDGSMLAYLSDESIWVRGTTRWEVLREIPVRARLVTFMPDGRLVWLSGDTVHIANASTFAEEFTLAGLKTDPRSTLNFSADGSKMCLLAARHSVEIWNLPGKTLETRQDFDEFASAAISPDGKLAAMGTISGRLYLWDAGMNRITAKASPHSAWLMDVTFSADSKKLVSSGGDQTMRLWDLTADEPLAAETGSWKGHWNEVWATRFSADGKKLVSGGKDAKVKLWSAEPPPRRIAEVFVDKAVDYSGFFPDSAHFRVRTAGNIQIRSTSSGALEGEWAIPQGYPGQLACYHKESALFATGRGDIVMHKLPSGEVTRRFDCSAAPAMQAAGLSSGEAILATINGPAFALSLWDFKTGAFIARPPYYVHNPDFPGGNQVAFSPDGRRVAYIASSQRVMIYDIAQKAVVHELKGFAWFLYCVAWSPDGRWIVTSGWDGAVIVWNPDTGRQSMPVLRAHFAGVPVLTFSADSRTLVSQGGEGTVRFWNLPTGTEVLTLEKASVLWGCPISPDGRTLIWRHNSSNTFEIESLR